MENNTAPTQKTPTASSPRSGEKSGSHAPEAPPLVLTDVSCAVQPSVAVTPTAGASFPAASSSSNNNGTAQRRTADPPLPPLPLPAVSHSSPASPSAVAAHGSAATPTALFSSTLHPVTAVTPSHAASNVSLATTSQTGEASEKDDSAATTAEVEAEVEPEQILTNGSIALAEFTSLLKPSENTNVLREHIIHLLRDVDAEDTLIRIARTLEAQEGNRSPAEVSSTRWNESRMTPTTTNASQSTRASISLSARHSRRSSAVSRQDATSFEALAGFSFLHSHRRTTSVQDSPSSQQPSEDTPLHNLSTRGAGAPMEVSFSSQSSHPTQDPDSRRVSTRKSRDDTASSLTALHTSQLSETAALRIDPLKREVPILPKAVCNEGRRVAVSAAPCNMPQELLGDSAGGSGGAGASSSMELVQPPPPLRVIPKTTAEEQQLRRLLRRCHSFANLEADVLEDVVKAMEKEVHAAGTAILEQGQDSSDKMYLVGEGTCEAIKNGRSMGPLQPGGTFGELELMYKQAKCAATIRCVTRCVLYSLDEASYHRAVMTNSLQKRKKFEALTLNVPFLRCMPDFERMKIAEALVTREYSRGQAIIKFGAPGTHMHFIVEGEVKVVGRNNGRKVEVVRLHAGDVVGELEFLFNHLTVADVIATSHRVVTACISRGHFELIIGPIQDRLKEFVATSATYEKYYLSEVADESVRSELSRIESSRKHRRVASKEAAVTLEDVNAHGEVLLSAPLALLHGKETPGDVNGGSPTGSGTVVSASEVLNEADGGAARLPKALLRFPFAPVTGKNVAVLAMREDGLIIYWNAVLERLTSYPAEEVVGQNIYSFLLAEREQQAMLKAITTARNFAGDVEAFLEQPSTKGNHFTLARSDGLTKATVQLTIVPPVVSAGGETAEVVLGFGEEVKQGPQKMLEQPQWLSAQVRAILADGTQTFEERLESIAETLNNFESTYRAMTVSTERLRVVNIRQMVGHVLMDFGSAFVTRGVSVRQRFEGLPSERAYLDADLLPECLRYAMKLCLKYSQIGGGVVTIMITVTEKNGLEFLIINFNLLGDGLPDEMARFFDAKFGQRGNSVEDDSSADEEEDENENEESNFSSDNITPKRGLPPRLRRKLRRVQRAVEEQGGTLRIQRNQDDANIVFLIPFMPASDEDVENASVEASLYTAVESSSQSMSTTNLPATLAAASASAAAAALVKSPVAASTPNGTSLLPADHSQDAGSVSALHTPGDESGLLNQPNFSFTTCLAEDTPAHRIMLSSFLWERRHAVLTAFKFDDVAKLLGVADILIIDLQQSVITSLHDDDPITRLREMLRHMAVIITSTSFDLVSNDTCEAAGFITLKKPCTPVQAVKAIRRAEEKSAVVKLERLRIEQTRETLARNSRGAWRRGALLGKGSFGEVYEAYDVLTGGKMAMKEMRLGANDAKIEQFVQEISTMCNLQHPNIIHYFYCEESKEQKVIRVFMEFAGGGTLQSLLKKKGKLDHTELRALLRDVVEGLAYIHSQHYVHCDIKTANVLLSAEGKGKIGDFGTAHTVHEGELLYVMQGSPLYMSPECMSAGEEDEDGTRIGYSFPSDIWSLGCVAMEMATTKPPFSHIKNLKGPAGLTNYITSLTDVPDLSPLFKCEPSVVEFVSACLNPDPEQRATAQQLLQMSLFSESTHSDRNSAVKALKRAQLLHVLNKFVAFQEPEEADKLERHRSRFRVRQPSSDFFSSSSDYDSESVSSSSSASSTTVTSSSLPDCCKNEKTALYGVSKSVVVGSNSMDAAANAAATPANVTTTDGEDPAAAAAAAASATPAPGSSTAASHTKKDGKRRNSSSSLEGEMVGTQFFRTLRKWHSSSSSSSSLSHHPAEHRGTDTPPQVGVLSARQASTSPASNESIPLTQAMLAGTDELHAPLRHHTDPNTVTTAVAPAGHDGDADDEDEPEARMPTSEDAYDLSPTPKKRSKTQSRPPASVPPQQLETTRKKDDKAAASRQQSQKEKKKQKQKQQRRRSPSSSSNSTDSNEAAFFATSSDSSVADNRHHNEDDDRTDTHGVTASKVRSLEKVAALTMRPREGEAAVSTATAATALASAATPPPHEMQLRETTTAAAASSTGTATQKSNTNPLSITPVTPTAPEHVFASLTQLSTATTTNTADQSSTSTITVSAANNMPTFTGRRQNVTMDDDGNIVTFQRFTSSGSASASRENSGVGGTPKLGAVSPAMKSEAAPPPPRNANAGGAYALGSPGMVALSSPAPALTNVSFSQQPPNMSFFNYSFNKNISFMGANIDDVLSSAANDFLSSLAAANNNNNKNNNALANVRGSSSAFSVDTQSAPSHAAERLSSAHSHSEGPTGNVPIMSSPLVPDTQSTADSVHAELPTVRRTSGSQSSLLSNNPSATLPARNRSADSVAAGSDADDGGQPHLANPTTAVLHSRRESHTSSGHNSPLPQPPPQPAAGRQCSRSDASTNGVNTTSSTPRGDSVPLVGTNASVARHPARVRPPITNQSFFVVEDLGAPTPFNASMTPSTAPFFAYAGGVNSSMLGGSTPASVAPVSATMSNATTNFNNGGGGANVCTGAAAAVAAGGGSTAGSGGAESTITTTPPPFHNHSNSNQSGAAIAAPPLLFSAFASATAAARDAWKRRRRHFNTGNEGSRYTLSHSNDRAKDSDTDGGGGAANDDSFCNNDVPSSAAFGSMPSGSSRLSSVHGGTDEVPYLTAERLQQVARSVAATPPPRNADADACGPYRGERVSSDGHSGVLFNSLTSHEESPLFTYLKRINESLIDVAAQLRARQRQSSDAATSAMLGSAVSVDQTSPSQLLSTPKSPRRRPQPFLPPSVVASASVAPNIENGPGVSGSSTPGESCGNMAAPQKGGGGGSSSSRNCTSLPRPVSTFSNSLATFTVKAMRRTPPLGPQMGRSNPLWPAEDAANASVASPPPVRSSSYGLGSTADSATSSAVSPPMQPDQPHRPSSDVDGAGGGGNVEALLQKMLKRVNTLIEQVSHLPQQAPSHLARPG